MKALIVINDIEDLTRTMVYARHVLSEKDELALVAIVPSSGEVPLKMDGQVLDECTEFNLNPLYEVRDSYKEKILQLLGDEKEIYKEVLIGDRRAIVKDRVKELEADVLVLASELTSESEDMFFKSHAEQIFKGISIPMLTFKCDKSGDPIKDIAILSDYKEDHTSNISAVKNIASNFEAQITLYGFVKLEEDKENMLSRMNEFIDKHGLAGARKVLLADDKETAAKDMLMKYPFQLMVLFDIDRPLVKEIFRGDLKLDILNHTAIPILAYN